MNFRFITIAFADTLTSAPTAGPESVNNFRDREKGAKNIGTNINEIGYPHPLYSRLSSYLLFAPSEVFKHIVFTEFYISYKLGVASCFRFI